MHAKAVLLILILVSFACNTPVPKSPEPAEVPVTPPPPKPQEPPNKAKNLILLIGDGMGLSQITGGMYLNNNKTALEKFPVVGIHKSHSIDNLVTDSAAGATAFACGVKTYNGAIAVDAQGQSVRTILEECEDRGMATGLVCTSTIVHATPACFFAHNKSRRNYEAIADDFLGSGVDLFIGGGRKFFTRREDDRNLMDELTAEGYYMSDYLTEEIQDVKVPEGKNLGYLTSDHDPLPVASGRDYLIPASKLSLRFLDERSEQGFFLMIEGAQIDWGGHANDPNYVLTEFIEYDRVISLAYDFAKKNKETLVVVTADHETGGFAINPESTMDNLKVSFTTGGHTAVMIPVFAYGPGAEHFGGIYDNTKIYDKLKKALYFKK